MKTDKDLYNEFLNGNNEAFNELISKYQHNLLYFIMRYIKSKEAAEDILQDVIVYVLEKKENYNFEYSFKTYLYMIAKSRALNYIKKQNRCINYNEYENLYEDIEDVEDKIFTSERQIKIRSVINKMKPDYQTAIYLTQIEDMSYKDVARIMDKDIGQIKALVHNSKKKLKELLKKEGVIEVKNNKLIRILAMFMVGIVVTAGLAYATYTIYNNYVKESKNGENTTVKPTYTASLSNIEDNVIWVGTFQLVWNDFMDELVGGPIEFVDGESELANELNKQSFTVNELSEDSYYKKFGETSLELKEEIENGIKEKFNEQSEVLDRIDWESPYRGHVLYVMLKKEFEYIEPFKELGRTTFADENVFVKYFGINDVTEDSGVETVDILFYNSETDFAIKLNTKEGEEVYLYRGANMNSGFNDIYEDLKNKTTEYTGRKELEAGDIVKIPMIKIKEDISYDELCDREIKGYEEYISQAIQTIDFELDNYGGYVKSEAAIETLKQAILNDSINAFRFEYTDEFVLFLKEEDKKIPYLALKVTDTKALVKSEYQPDASGNITRTETTILDS